MRSRPFMARARRDRTRRPIWSGDLDMKCRSAATESVRFSSGLAASSRTAGSAEAAAAHCLDLRNTGDRVRHQVREAVHGGGIIAGRFAFHKSADDGRHRRQVGLREERSGSTAAIIAPGGAGPARCGCGRYRL